MQSIEKMAGDGPHPPELMMMMMIEHRRPFSLVLGGDFIIIMPSYMNIYIYILGKYPTNSMQLGSI